MNKRQGEHRREGESERKKERKRDTGVEFMTKGSGRLFPPRGDGAPTKVEIVATVVVIEIALTRHTRKLR